MKAILNHNLTEEIYLKINDRGLQYGDGLFETIVVKDQKILFLNLHFDRLIKGMKTLQMVIPEMFGISYFESQVHELLKNNNLKDAIVNIVVWRKAGGTYQPENHQVNILLKARKLVEKKNKVLERVNYYTNGYNYQTPYSNFKTLNALPYVLAGIEKQKQQVHDLIILDHEGHISETIDKNIFWRINNNYFTPSLDTGCVAGIQRHRIIKHLRQLNISVEEVKLKKNKINEAQQVFACNVTGIYPILSIENQTFDVHLDEQLFQDL